MIDISDPRVRRTLSLAQSVVVRCMFGQPPTPRELEDVHRRLSDLLIIAASADGSESVSGPSELTPKDLISSSEAADIIECSPRWVTQIRDCLGAVRAGRAWAFPRQTVVDYANERRCR